MSMTRQMGVEGNNKSGQYEYDQTDECRREQQKWTI